MNLDLMKKIKNWKSGKVEEKFKIVDISQFNMVFFNLFRKKQEVVKEAERISFVDLDFWIKSKENILEKDNFEYLRLINKLKEKLIEELNQGLEGLDKIDWEKIKTEDRIKNIVKENLNNYIGYLKGLGVDLEKTNGERKNVEKIFSVFDKKAGMSYQKSTFLIGKEIEVINDSVALFFKDLKNLEKENKDLIEEIKLVNGIKNKNLELKEDLNKIEEVRKIIENINVGNERLNNEIKKCEGGIDEIKISEEYKKWKNMDREYNIKKDKLKLKIVELKMCIDFKKLSKDWHKNNLEMKVIKGYRDNFVKEFVKDKGEILKIVAVTLGNQNLIVEKLNDVLKLGKEVENFELSDSLTSKFEEKIEKLKKERNIYEMDKEKEEKRIEKIKDRLKIIKNSVIEEIEKINVELRD